MRELSDFIEEEMNSALDKVFEIKNQIRSIQLDIEVMDKACNRLSSNIDDTADIFLSSDNNNNFENDEINKLSDKRKVLQDRLNLCEEQLAGINLRYERLKSLSEICNSKTELKDLSKNIYSENSQTIVKHYISNNDCTVKYKELAFQEADRSRIAMDIHDTVIQNLTALLLKNDFAMKIMESDRERARIELNNNSKILRDSINELRNIVFNLRPMSVDNDNFEDSLKNVISIIANKTTMQIVYNCKVDNLNMYNIDNIILINTIRIISELCHNAIKHSNGTVINVSIDVEKSSVNDVDVSNLIINVNDDGDGFEFDSVIESSKTNFGLSMILERVNALGGNIYFNKNFQIDKKDRKGTDYLIQIPI